MSWTGTVRCGHCYESGHNKTGCPKLRAAWEKDPNSWQGREWARIKARKEKPKICGYCDTSGHTRAGCETAKKHKAQFQLDLNVWRKALAKWVDEVGLGMGALIRVHDVRYYRNGEYQYPGEAGYVPPVGMLMQKDLRTDLTHYHGIPGTSHWHSAPALLTFEYIGANEESMSYRRHVGAALPCIPGIIPRYGNGWYNQQIDRAENCDATDWEVVSEALAPLSTESFLSPKALKKVVKEHFGAKNEQTESSFKTLDDAQRMQLQQYVNGDIELSQMKDPEVPQDDS